jgi:hypothetical protein
MQAECSVNKIWTNLSGEIRAVRPALGFGDPYYIAFCSNGDMLTNDGSSLARSRFVLDSHATANDERRWNLIEVGATKYLIQSVSNPGLYLTADPASRTVSLAVLSNLGLDSDQHWRMDTSGDKTPLTSASVDTRIAGYKLYDLTSLFTTSHTDVGFLNASAYVPATEISVAGFDVPIGQPAYAQAPAIAPSNAFENVSDIWLTDTPSDDNMFTVGDNGLCTATSTDIGIAAYTVSSKITLIEGTATVRLVKLPHHYAQNKIKWCWAAAAKMVGEKNGDRGPLFIGAAFLADKGGVHSYNSVDFFGTIPNLLDPLDPLYTADAGQRQIVMATHYGSDENNSGNNAEITAGLELAALRPILVETRDAVPLTPIDINQMNIELAAGRWVVANVFRNSGGIGHSIVVKGIIHDPDDDIYTYWDPWTNRDRTFTKTDIYNNVIRLSTGTNVTRRLASVLFCRPTN